MSALHLSQTRDGTSGLSDGVFASLAAMWSALLEGESYTATRGMSEMCRDSVGEIVSGRWRHDGGQQSTLLTSGTNGATAQVYSGAALSPRAVVSLVTNDAATITTVINPSTSVQMALISGFTPSRTSE